MPIFLRHGAGGSKANRSQGGLKSRAKFRLNWPHPDGSLKQLVDQKPAWDKRAGDTLELLDAGKLPYFAAADVLGRTMLDLSLLPALSNPAETDVRNRRTIYAYSGARRPVPISSGGAIAVDLSALGACRQIPARWDLNRSSQSESRMQQIRASGLVKGGSFAAIVRCTVSEVAKLSPLRVRQGTKSAPGRASRYCGRGRRGPTRWRPSQRRARETDGSRAPA